MSKVIGQKIVKTRKDHVCFGCGKGSLMERSCVIDNGLWSCYLCPTCQEITSLMKYEDEYGFGDLREYALEKEGVNNG